MKTVAQLLVEHLIRWGVTHVFGIPGKPVTPLVMEMDRQGIDFVLSKHEGGAGFAAAGYAFEGGRLGAALGTAGPGGVNMLTAAGQAKATGVPVLFLTGQPPIKEIGKVLGQDSTLFGTDLVKMFEPVTKFSARIERGELLETYLRHAIEQACTGVKGPVHLSIPLDVLTEEVRPFLIPLPTHYPAVLSANLDQVIECLDAARRPVLFVGGGVHACRAYEELRQLAERWSIPVMTMPGGKGAFVSGHPLSLGPFGLGGNETSKAYMSKGVDVMIVVGSQLSDLELPGLTPDMYPQRMIHFDYEPTFIGKAVPVPVLPVLGDLKRNLQELLRLTDGRRVELTSAYAEAAAASEPAAEAEEPAERRWLTGRQTMRVLRSALPKEAVVYGDAGSHSFYAVKHLDIEVPGTFYFEEVYATMGRAIGYAVGAQLAEPDKTIVCLTGDGCLFMNGTEISTAVNAGAPVIFVVMNNGSLDMVEKGMARHLGRAIGTNYTVPVHAAKFGEAMGAEAFRCSTEAELYAAVTQALAMRRTTVIEVMADPLEIPPTMARG
ncbi:acetolactate synthase [Paenibacillus tyrfis]|uniref:thiamine pyrophosphate-binding protein n=1 Tax=Paenibacillus tyrfis TaxID=1501230 RepID=UPI0024901B53|nr:thiamine pyrophosphate-binding protein [Paenibacillus tyrfis]GLI04864.1 acetolactate synthase [Paenibacillus tyrfis]